MILSDGESSNKSDNILDARVWSSTEVTNFFHTIENSKYQNIINDQLLIKLDFNGQRLLSAENETLKIELKIESETDRVCILSHIQKLRDIIYQPSPLPPRQRMSETNINTNVQQNSREWSALVLLDNHDLYLLAMNTLLNLLLQHSENKQLFRDKECHLSVFSLLKSEPHVSAAIKLIRFMADKESVSDMLSTLHIERESFEYRINMLEALRQMIADTSATHIKNAWNDLLGFSTFLSVLASLDGVWHEQKSSKSRLAYSLIEKSFQLIVEVIRNHPRNRSYFWNAGWQTIADAINLTGILKSRYAPDVIHILFGLVTENLNINVQNVQNFDFDDEKKIEKNENKKFVIKKIQINKNGFNENLYVENLEPMFIQNAEAILVILKLLTYVSPVLQIQQFNKLLFLINLKINNDYGYYTKGRSKKEEYLLRNKQILNNHSTIQHTFEMYSQILQPVHRSSSVISEIADAHLNVLVQEKIHEFITELGTHSLSAKELNMILVRSRENNERNETLLKYLSGEHKFPFFEFETYSKTYACIKMSGNQSLFNWKSIAPNGHSFSIWFNLRSMPHKKQSLTLFQVLSENQANILQCDYSIDKGLLFTCGQSYQEYDDVNDVSFLFHRWYHLVITLTVVEDSLKKNSRQRKKIKSKNNKYFADFTVYINGVSYRNFTHQIFTAENMKRSQTVQSPGGSTTNRKTKVLFFFCSQIFPIFYQFSDFFFL